MIELDLAGESRMMDHYEQAIRLISDEQIQKLLHHIMEEEKCINTLISLRDSL